MSFGAELSSLKDNESTEYIWQGDKKYWERQSPLLFPIIGKLINNTTYFNGVSYKIPQHGFIRDYEFKLISKTENSITLECNSNDETLKKYPFSFNFTITYTIRGRSLIQTFSVQNCSDKKMSFALGGHTGFNCPILKGERFEDYTVEFIKSGNIKESQLGHSEKSYIQKEENFNLRYSTFDKGVLIFENKESKGLKLINNNTKRGIQIDYEEFNLVGVWTPGTINSPFICIEPWIGLLKNQTDKKIEFNANMTLACISPNEVFKRLYGVTII